MQERSESQGFYEMLWNCEFCGNSGLLAKSQRHCPECGAKQNADKRYFPQQGQEVQVQGHKYEGADRYCPACHNPQSALGKNCQNCGSPMDGSSEVQGVHTPVAPPKKKSKLWIVILIVVLVLAIVGIVIGVKSCHHTKEAGGKVTAHAWERSVTVEEYAEVRETAWRDRVPFRARRQVCHRAQRSTKKIPDGEECRTVKKDKKDGTFEKVKKCKTKYRSEPVYDQRCSYLIEKWKQVDTLRANGSGTTLSDPPNLPAATAAPRIGARRTGARKDTYYLELEIPKGKQPKQRCDVDQAIWNKLSDGASVKLQVDEDDGEVDCDESF